MAQERAFHGTFVLDDLNTCNEWYRRDAARTGLISLQLTCKESIKKIYIYIKNSL